MNVITSSSDKPAVKSLDSPGGTPQWQIGRIACSLILGAALLALIAKVYCASTTIGTTDTFLFYRFALEIEKDGLLQLYSENRLFNHTPMIGELIVAASRLDQSLGRVYFPLLLRLPGIFADLVSVFTLIWLHKRTGRPEPWAIVLFALSPVAFMVSGYHGNIDSLLTAILLLSASFCVAQRPLECGVFLGLACNVKVVALLLSPVFFFIWIYRRQTVPFTFAAVATTLAGWAVPLLIIPKIFLKNVLGYGGIWGDWGVTYFLSKTGWDAMCSSGHFDVSPFQNGIASCLKIAIVLSVLIIAWRRRAVDSQGMFNTIALVWAIFFVFAPGGAAQYMVWLAPFVVLASSRWYVALTVASTIFLFVFYNSVSEGMPWSKGTSPLAAPIWRPWTTLPWAVLFGFLIWSSWNTWVRRSRLASHDA